MSEEFAERKAYEQDLYENDGEPLSKLEKIAIDCFIDYQQTRHQEPCSSEALGAYNNIAAYVRKHLANDCMKVYKIFEKDLLTIKAALTQQSGDDGCLHKNTTMGYDHVICYECNAIKTDHHKSWGLAKNMWFKGGISEAHFYKDKGYLPPKTEEK